MTTTPGLAAAIAAAAPNLSAADQARWVAAFDSPMQTFEINTPNRIAGFIGQCAYESSCFVELVENLNYSVANCCNVWPSRFPTAASATPYARNPEALANHVYCDRMGNGNEASGDGWTFRGHGALQTTGRDSITRVAAYFQKSADDMAAWMATPEGAAAAAAWDWNDMACNPLADAWNMQGLTERINGGLTGYAGRVVNCDHVLAVLQAAPTTPAPSPTAMPPVLSLGDTGTAVVVLQGYLKTAGFYLGYLVDGNYGPATKDAVADYQARHSLFIDGVAGAVTLKALGLA